ncbi:hypothetical protein DAPPUDRAFT_105211 [Daphnia pulex]|uniref:Uncharacterized protein n=1 Tax=Daphnia pulex TaxID=6669 RepID=E9GPS5_DAPPU|nr:hypothetical protein DAPPUDRAFT_105211 [Daphnia pulex]|eukprot:EFX78434.1 hypothetical protein DAPPUDRAFT_105211 [Daphnia pulex]
MPQLKLLLITIGNNWKVTQRVAGTESTFMVGNPVPAATTESLDGYEAHGFSGLFDSKSNKRGIEQRNQPPKAATKAADMAVDKAAVALRIFFGCLVFLIALNTCFSS